MITDGALATFLCLGAGSWANTTAKRTLEDVVGAGWSESEWLGTWCGEETNAETEGLERHAEKDLEPGSRSDHAECSAKSRVEQSSCGVGLRLAECNEDHHVILKIGRAHV